MQADAFIEKPTQPAELPAKATDLLRGGEAEKGS
jgi:DNA-binding response OmpR family regulator